MGGRGEDKGRCGIREEGGRGGSERDKRGGRKEKEGRDGERTSRKNPPIPHHIFIFDVMKPECFYICSHET